MNRILAAAYAAVLVFACAPTALAAQPPKDPDLQRLSAQLAQLDADPVLGPLGGVDRLKAHQALAALAATAPHSDDRKPALYLAERRVQAARFAAEADQAQAQIDQLDRDRDRILLDASRRDADRARMEVERMRMQNKARDEEAQRAAADQQARQDQEASLATDASDQAQALAEAKAKAAGLAQQEAALQAAAAGTAAPPVSTPSASGSGDPRGPTTSLPGSAFLPGRATLRMDKAGKARIQALIDFVGAQDASATIRIESHTDSSAGAQKALALSQQRAETIKNYLRAAGVAPNRIQAIGLGAVQPVASNATAAGRARNNRILVIAVRAAGGQ
ncbi:MAG: OmpA family protein [Proteobacteria bacterium]|nr:OmpA family protein [Pseudomonadota bacterium]